MPTKPIAHEPDADDAAKSKLGKHKFPFAKATKGGKKPAKAPPKKK